MNPSSDWQTLEKNICDTLKEWELKIGYSKQPVELYYPAESLCQLLGVDGGKQLQEALALFSDKVRERLGALRITESKGKVCIRISEAGNRYVREHISASPFLVRFLEVIHQPDSSLTAVEQVFYEFSSQVVKRQEEDGECIFYFQDSAIDEYVYCVKEDEFGIEYHRFTKADYRNL